MARRVIDWNKWNAKEADVEVCFLFFDGAREVRRTIPDPPVRLSFKQPVLCSLSISAMAAEEQHPCAGCNVSFLAGGGRYALLLASFA